MPKFRKLVDKFDGWKVFDGEMVRRLRAPDPQKKLPLKKVAQDLGKSVCQLSAYENGKSMPSLVMFKQMCLYFQVDANVLLGLRWVDDD